MPAYSKYLKNLCTKKRGPYKIDKTQGVNQIDSLFFVDGVVKYKDPGKPIINVCIDG